MPIINIQRRQAELGRIRLGQKITGTSKAGKTFTRPEKLDRFRFTSVSEQYIRDLAELYGGEARAWDNNGIPSWEVITEATSIPVVAVKGGLSQWMETWSGGGCSHRCDGERQIDGTVCSPDDTLHAQAKPTTRLSVMLTELEALGVWRLETHGWNAAAEIPAVAELAQFVGELVPAVLNLVERRAIVDGKTSRFVVPVLDLRIGAAKLREVVAAKSGVAEIEAPAASSAPAIEAPAPAAIGQAQQLPEPTAEQVASCTDPETLRRMWKASGPERQAQINARAAELSNAGAQPEPAVTEAPAAPVEDDVHDAVIVDEQPVAIGTDRDELWQRLMLTAGKLGMTLWDVEELLSDSHQTTPADATIEQFAATLQTLQATAGEAVPA